MFEREFIKRKLTQHSNNVAKTSEAIGVQRSYLYKKLKKLNLTGVLDAKS
jgi:two-component system nitrogen regulation response regulator NtrX